MSRLCAVAAAAVACLLLVAAVCAAHPELSASQLDKIAPRQFSDVLAVARQRNPTADEDTTVCTACVLGLLLIDDNVLENEQAIDNFLLSMCAVLKQGEERDRCEFLVNEYGIATIQHLIDEHGPNKVCEKVGVCKGCVLALPSHKENERPQIESALRFMGLLMDIAYLKEKGSIPRRHRDLEAARAGADPNPSEAPAIDIDGDLFAPTDRTRRGSKWRGRDCNDLTKNVRPGVHDDPTGLVDNNCNGVKGVNNATNSTYENELCQNDQPSRKSIVTFGDSAAAAFAIPVEWMSLQDLPSIVPAALQELDWPQQSWSTGYEDYMNYSSVYQNFREWNRCNHRDYQNLAKNGAKMVDLAQQARNMKPSTFPTLGFIAYIGNDVCRRSLDSMTTPVNYRKQLLEGLEELDKLLLPGSSLLISGLVDGRVLWDTMHNRTHPLGCTYAALYEFLTCTNSNPCNTWLNPNARERNLTTDRAMELSQVAQEVVETTHGRWKNFVLGYEDFPADVIFTVVEKMGRDPAYLIEQVDGFHPSPAAQQMTGKVVWNLLRTRYSSWIGKKNPNNDKIEQLFGNQGGN